MKRSVILIAGWAWLAAGACLAAEVLVEESFKAYEPGAVVEAPWQSSTAHTGITVVVGHPAGVEGEGIWLNLADPVAGASRACANIRREIPALTQGELSFRWHIKSLARFAVYLGTGSASSPGDRVVGFKMHEDGRPHLVNDMLAQRPTWSLQPGVTYDVKLAFQPRDEETKNITLVFDDGEEPRTLEAVVPKGEPITAMRLTTENQDAGGDFYVTDLVLKRLDG